MIRNFTYLAQLGIFGWLTGVMLKWWPPVAGHLEWTVFGGVAALFVVGLGGVALNAHVDKQRYQPLEDKLHQVITCETGGLNAEVVDWRKHVVEYVQRQLHMAQAAASEEERDTCLDRAVETAKMYDVDPRPFYDVGRRVYRTYVPKHCRWLMDNWKNGKDLVIFHNTGEKPEGLRGLQPTPFEEGGRDLSLVEPVRAPEVLH